MILGNSFNHFGFWVYIYKAALKNETDRQVITPNACNITAVNFFSLYKEMHIVECHQGTSS